MAERIALATSGMTFEIAAAEVAFGLEVAYHRLDGGASSHFPFDDTEDAAFLSADEDAARVLGVVPAVTLVDIAALDLAAGKNHASSKKGISKMKSQVSASEAHKTLQSQNRREPKTDSRSMAYKLFTPDGLSRAGASRYVRSRPLNTMLVSARRMRGLALMSMRRPAVAPWAKCRGAVGHAAPCGFDRRSPFGKRSPQGAASFRAEAPPPARRGRA
jgi:hypothetical protein